MSYELTDEEKGAFFEQGLLHHAEALAARAFIAGFAEGKAQGYSDCRTEIEAKAAERAASPVHPATMIGRGKWADGD